MIKRRQLMTEKDFMDNLEERFYWCYFVAEKEYLAKKATSTQYDPAGLSGKGHFWEKRFK